MRSARAPLILVAALLALFCAASSVAAAPTITITPASGPSETEFVADLRGFTPGERVALRLTTSESPPRSLTIPAITIDQVGGYRLTIPALGLTPGDYTLAALRNNEIVASARFTVVAAASATPTRAPATPTQPQPTRTPTATATVPAPTPPTTGSGGNLPGLPNTGAGGGFAPGLLCIILAAALLGTLYVLRAGRAPARREMSKTDQSGGRR